MIPHVVLPHVSKLEAKSAHKAAAAVDRGIYSTVNLGPEENKTREKKNTEKGETAEFMF